MKTTTKTIISILTSIGILLSGCGTTSTFKLAENTEAKKLAYRDIHYECDDKPSEFVSIPYIYSGTKKDVLYLTWPYHCDWAHGEVGMLNNALYLLSTPFIAIDLVFSFAADTVMLPYTIPKQRKEGNIIDPPYIVIARDHYRHGRENEAIEYYEKGLEILPKYYGDADREAHIYIFDLDGDYYDMATIYEKRNDLDKAIYCYEKLIELNTNEYIHPSILEWYYTNLANVYLKAGYRDKANESYSKAREYKNRSLQRK